MKSANLLFSTLEPSYIWTHCGHLFGKACNTKMQTQGIIDDVVVRPIGSGMPDLVEVCILTEFLLETVSLDAFIDAPSEHLPGLFYEIVSKLLHHINILSSVEISKSLKLCAKILSKVQPTMITAHTDKCETDGRIDTSLNNVIIPSDNSLVAIPLEKSQSDSKLNKPDVSGITFVEKSPSTRRRANSGGAVKRNDKKSKKKGSKNKLADTYTIQADGSSISVIVSEDVKSLPRNKSMDDIKASVGSCAMSPSPKNQLSTLKRLSVSPTGSTGSLYRGPSPAFQAQHSMLEKCLRQYETFYVKLISNRILSKERTVQDMFDRLMVSSPRKSFDERMHSLEHLLNSRLNMEDSGFLSQDTPGVTEDTKCLDIFHLCLDITSHAEWTEAMKIASSLFVELSTFPKYFLPGDNVLVEEEPEFKHALPDWLMVLIVCSCWLQKQPALQLTSIATLLDLIALLKAHNDIETHPKSGEGVTTVIMVPLLKQWHMTYLMQCTNVFQVYHYNRNIIVIIIFVI